MIQANRAKEKVMTEEIIQKYRDILQDSIHEFYNTAWLIFQERMNLRVAAKLIQPQQDIVLPYLYEIIETPDLYLNGSLGKGWAPINAISLIGEWKIIEAAPILIERLLHESEWDIDDISYNKLVICLSRLGPPIFDEVWAAHERFVGLSTVELGYLEVLVDVGKDHPKVSDYIKVRIEAQPQNFDLIDYRLLATYLLELDYETNKPYLNKLVQSKQFSQVVNNHIKSGIEEFEVDHDIDSNFDE